MSIDRSIQRMIGSLFDQERSDDNLRDAIASLGPTDKREMISWLCETVKADPERGFALLRCLLGDPDTHPAEDYN